MQTYFHVAAWRRIADCIVDQVAYQGDDIDFLRRQRNFSIGFNSDIDLVGLRQRQAIRNHTPQHSLQGYLGDLAGLRRAGILRAGQRQQLFQQRFAAIQALPQRQQARFRGWRKVGCREIFRLQRQGCQRRTQLMRGVGKKASLCIHVVGNPSQQTIDRADQGPDFIRHMLLVEWTYILIVASVDFLRQPCNRSQHAAHHDTDQRNQYRDQHHEWHHGSQAAVARNLVAHLGLLAHGQPLAGCGRLDKQAPRNMTYLDCLDAVGQVGGQA